MSSPFGGTVPPSSETADRVLQRATRDVRKLLATDVASRGRLVEELKKFTPSMSTSAGPTEEDGRSVAAAAGVDLNVVSAALRLAYFLVYQKSLDRDQNTAEVLSVASSREKSPGPSRTEIDALLSLLSPVAVDLERASQRVMGIEAPMPSLQQCRIACDIRMLSDTPLAGSEFAAVAIVRLELDEGDPVVFQCLPEALRLLSARFSEAYAALKTLEKRVEGLKS